nr:eukaryotic translation initiation factor 3 subunit b [Quercus suber]
MLEMNQIKERIFTHNSSHTSDSPCTVVKLLQENLQQWLIDEKARDQFVIHAGSDTKVLRNDTRHLKPEPVYKRAVSRIYI